MLGSRLFLRQDQMGLYFFFICIHMVIDFDLSITFNQYGILSTAKYEFIYYYSAFILINIFQNKNNYVNIFLQNQYFLSLKHQQSCFCTVFFLIKHAFINTGCHDFFLYNQYLAPLKF